MSQSMILKYDDFSTYLVRQQELTQAFWQPAFRHWSDLESGAVPKAEDITRDYVFAYLSFQRYLRILKKDLPGLDKLNSVFNELATQRPELLDEVAKDLNSIAIDVRKYAPSRSIKPSFIDLGSGKLGIVFHSVSQKVSFCRGEAAVQARKTFGLNLDVSVLSSSSYPHPHYFKIRKNRTKSPIAFEIALNEGEESLCIFWGNGTSTERHLLVERRETGLEILPAKRDRYEVL
jgi:hypothetical protein